MFIRDFSPQHRRLLVLANLCLVIGLLLPMVFHLAGGTPVNVLHFVRGLLIGLSLSLNLGVLWKTRRRRRPDGL